MRGRRRRAMLLLAFVGPASVMLAIASGPPAGTAPRALAANAAQPGQHTLVGPSCGPATTATLALADGMVAERIYRDELVGVETLADRRQVEGYAPLLSALASGNRAAVTEAVHALVYSHTHIVRLRVIQHGTVLADIGGPYIIAPVAGRLFNHGTLVGSYLLSVQDDLGVVGLVKRFIGVPLTLHVGRARVPLPGTLRTGALTIPDHGPVTFQGHGFEAFSFEAKAFPTGLVRISLLLAHQAGSARTCAAVRVAELARIGRSIWRRFVFNRSPIVGFPGFLHSHTGGLAFIRAGSRQIAGPVPAPARLPASGAIRFRGKRCGVTSFVSRTPEGRVRVYQLVAL